MGDNDKRIDALYSLFDALMWEGDFEVINILIEMFDAQNISITDAITVLTITSVVDHQLPSRAEFFNKFAQRSDVIGRPGLLTGLEPKNT